MLQNHLELIYKYKDGTKVLIIYRNKMKIGEVSRSYKWIDRIGNVYNRMVIRTKYITLVGTFWNKQENGRLFRFSFAF